MRKKRLIQTLRLHYVPWFKISLFITGLVFIITIFKNRDDPNDYPVNFEIIVGLILVVFAMTFFIGGIFHLHHAFYSPWRQKQLLLKKAMVGFEQLGFKIDLENLCYNGYIDNYFINLIPITIPISGEWINANAFIYLKDYQTDDLEKLAKNYNVEFNDGISWVTTQIIVRFNQEPDIEKVKSQLEDFINEIKEYNIEPLKITTDDKTVVNKQKYDPAARPDYISV